MCSLNPHSRHTAIWKREYFDKSHSNFTLFNAWICCITCRSIGPILFGNAHIGPNQSDVLKHETRITVTGVRQRKRFNIYRAMSFLRAFQSNENSFAQTFVWVKLDMGIYSEQQTIAFLIMYILFVCFPVKRCIVSRILCFKFTPTCVCMNRRHAACGRRTTQCNCQ